MIMALLFAVLLFGLGIYSIRSQTAQLRQLKAGPQLASDDRSYLKRRAYRRLVNALLLMVLAGMLAGTYLSGLEERINAIAADQKQDGLTPEEKQIAWFWGYYWMIILILIFLVVASAIVDLWATRRYAHAQLRRLREDHHALLDRDLALYRQQRNDRFRYGLSNDDAD